MDELVLRVKWAKHVFIIELDSADATVMDLRSRLEQLTEVLPHRQKIMGLGRVGGRAAEDATLLSSLNLSPGAKLMMVGTPESELAAYVDAQDENDQIADSVVDDFALDLPARALAEAEKALFGVKLLTAPEVWNKKLDRRVAELTITNITPFRDGKKLLVLDLDHTLFDCSSSSVNITQLSRPGLHEFMATAYQHFDLCIWSQTSWRWLEAKITELGMLTNPNYRLAFVLDRTFMFSVKSVLHSRHSNGRARVRVKDHEVKSLEIVWRKFPERFGAWNTVHVDDLARNFALNLQSGILIRSFSNGPRRQATDRELPALAQYLVAIARDSDDFRTLDHSKWRDDYPA